MRGTISRSYISGIDPENTLSVATIIQLHAFGLAWPDYAQRLLVVYSEPPTEACSRNAGCAGAFCSDRKPRPYKALCWPISTRSNCDPIALLPLRKKEPGFLQHRPQSFFVRFSMKADRHPPTCRIATRS